MITYWKDNTAPRPPYYAVIFISIPGENREGYEEMDDYLMEEAKKQSGYLGYSSVSNTDGQSIFISYWKDTESISLWRKDKKHQEAKAKAKDGWYKYFHSIISEVKVSEIFEEQWGSQRISK